MNEIKENFKSLLKDKKKMTLIVAGVFAILFLFLSELIPAEKESVSREDNTSEYASRYISNAEKELENILSQISGAGKVRVMITVDSTYENVFAKGYTSSVQENENETKSQTQEEYITVKKGSQNEESLIVKVYEPQIKGVAVVAQGAGDIYVKKAITEAVCALYDISSAKVSVSIMK